MGTEPVELALQHGSPLRDPLLSHLQCSRVDAAGAHSANLLGPDDSAVLQHLEVLDDRGERYRERSGELADRGRPSRQPLDNEPSAWDRERMEDPFGLNRLVKHGLKYMELPYLTVKWSLNEARRRLVASYLDTLSVTDRAAVAAALPALRKLTRRRAR